MITKLTPEIYSMSRSDLVKQAKEYGLYKWYWVFFARLEVAIRILRYEQSEIAKYHTMVLETLEISLRDFKYDILQEIMHE
jgi:hypothetical protein